GGATPAPAAPDAAPPAAAAAGTGTLGLFDLDGPTVEARTIELADRLLGFLVRRHLDEAEAARPAGVTVRHDAGGLDIAARGERLPQTVCRRGKGEASNEEFHSHGERPLWPSPLSALTHDYHTTPRHRPS